MHFVHHISNFGFPFLMMKPEVEAREKIAGEILKAWKEIQASFGSARVSYLNRNQPYSP